MRTPQMRLFRLRPVVGILVLLCVGVIPAAAGTVFDNFGIASGGTSGTMNGVIMLAQRFSVQNGVVSDPWNAWALGGSWFSSTVGSPFQMSVSVTDGSLDSVEAAIFNDMSGTTIPGSASLFIYQDFNNLALNQVEPGAVVLNGDTLAPDLTAWSGAFPTALTVSGGVVTDGVTFTPGSSVSLTTGNHYWVVLSTETTGDEFAWSYEAPEPGTFGLAAAAMALLAYRRFRRSRQA